MKVREIDMNVMSDPDDWSDPGAMPDGSPQLTPVWRDYDGTYILVNPAKGFRQPGKIRVTYKIHSAFTICPTRVSAKWEKWTAKALSRH